MVDRRAAVGFLHEMARPAASEIRAWFEQRGHSFEARFPLPTYGVATTSRPLPVGGDG